MFNKKITATVFFSLFFAIICAFALSAPSALAQEKAASVAIGAEITLPAPDKQGGMPLQKALAERKSTRTLSNDALTMQQISDLLWSTWGISREDGKRTAPSAKDTQRAILFAAKDDGVWQYDAKNNSLKKVSNFIIDASYNNAPLVLVYAAENSKTGAMLVGSMFQNAGLHCASAGLAGVVKTTGIEVFQKDLKLPKGYTVMIIQPVGK